jgi:hypothetical protein
MRRFLGLTAVVLALAFPAASSPASVSGPQCGDVVTTDVVLTEDLVCSGDGLVIPGFADIKLNLNGHSITGSGDGTGIAILPEQNETVTVESGTIQGFDAGLAIRSFGLPTLVLDRLLILDNSTGVTGGFSGSSDTVLSNSVIAQNAGDGVRIGQGSPFKMVNDEVRNNGGNGISAFVNSLRLLQDSFIAHNGGAGAFLDNTVAVISGNTFLGNGQTGLDIHNEICESFRFYSISDNVAYQNGGGGMSMRANCAFTPPPPPGSGNAAKNNRMFQCVVIVCAKNPGRAKE